MKTSMLKMNPNNPRRIQPDKLEKLMRSIESFPEMMKLRPIVYDPETMHVLGGNQRLAAIRKLGMKEIPDEWAIAATDLTPEQQKEFALRDNVQFGEWDFEVLDTEFAEFDLAEMGIEVPEVSFTPSETPGMTENNVTDKDVENETISPNVEDKKDYIDLICPKCGHEYYIEKP